LRERDQLSCTIRIRVCTSDLSAIHRTNSWHDWSRCKRDMDKTPKHRIQVLHTSESHIANSSLRFASGTVTATATGYLHVETVNYITLPGSWRPIAESAPFFPTIHTVSTILYRDSINSTHAYLVSFWVHPWIRITVLQNRSCVRDLATLQGVCYYCTVSEKRRERRER